MHSKLSQMQIKNYKLQLKNGFLEKIYGFAFNKTHDRATAEELAQEIYREIYTALARVGKIDNFYSWVWAIAKYTYYHWCHKRDGYNVVELSEALQAQDDVEQQIINDEEIILLRREISFLSETQRNIVIMHYLEEKSCDEISCLLNIPVGTVKWRLHQARYQIKEGMDTMRSNGIKSYKPDRLYVRFQGDLDFKEDSVIISRKLPQNILLEAYDRARTMEELSGELGISMPYMEEEVDILLKHEFLKRVGNERYQTNFVIIKSETEQKLRAIILEIANTVYDKVMKFFQDNRESICNIKFYGYDFPWEVLLWTLIPMAITKVQLEATDAGISKAMLWKDIPIRPNGAKWIAKGTEIKEDIYDDYYKRNFFYNGPFNVEKGKIMIWYFETYWTCSNGVYLGKAGDTEIKICKSILNDELDIDSLSPGEKESLAMAVEKGIIVKKDDKYKLNFLIFNRQQLHEINQIFTKLFYELKEDVSESYSRMRKAIEKEVPSGLLRELNNNLESKLKPLSCIILNMALEEGKLKKLQGSEKHFVSFYMKIGYQPPSPQSCGS